MVTLCFAATSAPPVKASDQPRQPAQAGTAQTNQSPTGQSPTVPNEPATVFGYRDFSKQRQWDHIFLGVPSPARAEQHMKILTALPHIAGSLQDRHTAEYVAKQFKVA